MRPFRSIEFIACSLSWLQPSGNTLYLIYDGDEKLSKGGGISLSETAFFEAVFEHYHPKNILVIGNSLGWSTLALGLINPAASIVAIDLCPREAERRGIEVTNMLGK